MKISECKEALRLVSRMKEAEKVKADLLKVLAKIDMIKHAGLFVDHGPHRGNTELIYLPGPSFLFAISAAIESLEEGVKTYSERLVTEGFEDDTEEKPNP